MSSGRASLTSKVFPQATGGEVRKSNPVDNFFKKVLDSIAIDNLYKQVRAMSDSRTTRKKTSMMTGRINKEHSMKWQPSAAMYRVVCSLGLTLSAANIFGGLLGQETSIDSRRIKQH